MNDQDSDPIKKARFKTLNIDGTKYKTNLTKKFEEREFYTYSESKLVKAFIPGTILKISVKEGQVVKFGTRLLILEAMKMKNRIDSTFQGTISKINVIEGQTVAKNAILIEII